MDTNKEMIKQPAVVNNKRNVPNLNLLGRNFRGGRCDRIGDASAAKKRVFVPNIPVRRERSKENFQEQKKGDKSKNDRNQRDRGGFRGGRGRGRGRGRGELIQTEGGVFAAGPSASVAKREYGPRITEGSSIQMPKFTPVSMKTKEEREEEEEKIKNILKDDFIEDDYEYDDIKPVKLPLLAHYKCKEEIKPDLTKVEIKKELKDDNEDMDIDTTSAIIKKEEVKKEEYEDEKKTIGSFFTDDKIPDSGMFLFLQFPNCPLRNFLLDDDKPKAESKPSITSNEEKEEDENEVFKDIPEGLIGKLLILKSGKIILRLGSMSFNIENGTKTGFLQEVVSLNVNEESKDLHILGYLNNRIVCLPDINSLVANICI